MSLLLLAIACFPAGGLAALLAARSPRRAGVLGAAGAVAGSLLGFTAVSRFLALGTAEVRLDAAWPVPGGSLSLVLDPLAALFLLPLFLLGALGALYGHAYLPATHAASGAGRAWLFYDLLIGSIAVVLLAGNAVLFLVSWEVTAVASFFLVTLDDEEETSRAAGWTYLVASHFGTAFLIVLFVLLGGGAGSLDFRDFGAAAGAGGAGTGALFLLALAGFGVKAGLVPFHVWLPEAHPAAPSHVSALMSAVMIKTGIYGIARALGFLGQPAEWWGWALVVLGAVSGIGGVIFALAQDDLKRLLAYSSVENAGIITMGLGVGVLGVSSGYPGLAALGFAGALLHVLNHAVFKGLLFLGAGAVAAATGTRDMERLGGLLRLAPWTGVTFLVGAAAIAGLPPLNGIAGEFLILIGALEGVATQPAGGVAPLLVVIGALALIAGLAAACFAKAFGIVFLGTPRTPLGREAADPAPPMRLALALLAAACAVLGLASPWIVPRLDAAVAALQGGPAEPVRETLAAAGSWLEAFIGCAVGAVAIAALLLLLRRLLLSRREVREGPTWDCGYAAPTARMQYTGASFSQPLTSLFQPVLGTRELAAPQAGLFPGEASFATRTLDPVRQHVYVPCFLAVQRAAARLRGLQHGRLQLYVLYIAATLVALLLWEFAWNR